MEIGSFIELQFHKNNEYYSGDKDIARLNTGRAAIWHAIRVLKSKKIWLPYYQCDTVRDFLRRKSIEICFYHLDESFNPIDLSPDDYDAVLLVNYFGVMSYERMKNLASRYKNVIIDNSQAFFAKPIEECMNVYSCRKFIGVPDGAYVVGKNAHFFVNEYEQGYSSDTSLFLLQRIEYGCEGKAYESRKINEKRIDTEDIKRMSFLTRTILLATDYHKIISKRIENFEIASRLFTSKNRLRARLYYDNTCIPMVYPLVIEDNNLLVKLQNAKHFQGHWWEYLLKEMKSDSFEYWLSRYIIPITIDQRYSYKELEYLNNIMEKNKY